MIFAGFLMPLCVFAGTFLTVVKINEDRQLIIMT